MPVSGEPPKRQGYGADPTHPYGLLTPRFWHGMGAGTWLRLLARNRCRVSMRGAFTAATVFGVGCHNSFYSMLQEQLLGGRIRRARLAEPPLFVLGHWRSGTTLLHEFLIRDPEHTYPTTYECFAPRHFLITESWVTPLTNWLIPQKRPMDNVATGWDRPQEDEFALASAGVPSPYRCWAFPQHGPVDREYLTLETVSAEERAHWIAELDHFVKSLSLRNHKRVVLKSPPHTARVKLLLEAFPDAKFVHIVRDPLVLFPSTVRLWKSLCDVQGLQKPQSHYDWIEDYVLDNLVEMYEAYERDRALIPEGSLVEVRYEDLVADPKGEVKRIYELLGLGQFERVEPALDQYLSETRDYKTNRYSLPPQVEQRVRGRWRPYFERYGYSAPRESSGASPT